MKRASTLAFLIFGFFSTTKPTITILPQGQSCGAAFGEGLGQGINAAVNGWIAGREQRATYEASRLRSSSFEEQAGEVWRSLVDKFRDGKVEFTVSLSHIQTVFSELKIK